LLTHIEGKQLYVMLLFRLPFNWSGKVRSSSEGKEDGDRAEKQETAGEEQEQEAEAKTQKELEKNFDPKVCS